MLDGARVVLVDGDGQDEVVDGVSGEAHLLAHVGAADVVFRVVGLDGHGLVEQFGGGTQIVLLDGDTGKAYQGVRAARVDALQALVVGFGLVVTL